MALIEIVDNILEDFEKGKYIAGIYIDFSKAFDTVDHQIRLDKLEHYGFRGQILKWLTSYLHNRQQYTVMNDKNSSLKCINYGVPQGSVLGALLFLIHTNDIKNSTRGFIKTRLFANDSNAFVTKTSAEKLKRTITKVLTEIFD